MERRHLPYPAGGLTPEQRADLGDLGPLVARLAAYPAPGADAGAEAALIEELRPLVAARAEVAGAPDRAAPGEAGVVHWLRLARAQTALLDPAFWWASVVVLLLGLGVALVGGGGLLALLFLLLAPVLAAAGVAFAYRPAGRTVWELEQISPVRPLELLYARLALVLGYNLVFLVLLLGVVWLEEPRVVLWRLVLVWLGPMLGLSGAALYAAVRWSTLAGVAVPAVLWSGAVFAVWRWAGDAAMARQVTEVDLLLWRISQGGGILLASAACVVLGILLLARASRLATRETLVWS